MTLWVVYWWLHEYERFVTHSPTLLARSVERDSGKRHAARRDFVPGPPGAERSSRSPGPRCSDRSPNGNRPSSIDEGDDAHRQQCRSAQRLQCGMDAGPDRNSLPSRQPRSGKFSTFGPKVLGMKGDQLPDTTLSRSIAIDMKPKSPARRSRISIISTTRPSPACGVQVCAGAPTTPKSWPHDGPRSRRNSATVVGQLAAAAGDRGSRWT